MCFSLTCSGRHRKWPYLGGKPPLFWFFKITGKVVENHPVSGFFVKSVKTGGFRPNIVVFSKIRQNGWFSATFPVFQKNRKSGKKTTKLVVSRPKMNLIWANLGHESRKNGIFGWIFKKWPKLVVFHPF